MTCPRCKAFTNRCLKSELPEGVFREYACNRCNHVFQAQEIVLPQESTKLADMIRVAETIDYFRDRLARMIERKREAMELPVRIQKAA